MDNMDKTMDRLIPNTSILIDYWKQMKDDRYIRFMTHLFSNSVKKRSCLVDSKYTIYTSPFIKWYLVSYLKVNSDRIIALELKESVKIYDPYLKQYFLVTALDSNYSPGSIMLLFQGPFGNVFYTGFFRYNNSSLNSPDLNRIIENKDLHTVYIDNTYAATHCVFPSRENVIEEIVNSIRNKPEHKVLIAGKQFGKEHVLCEIAQTLKEPICVSEEKYIMLSGLGISEYFTIDSENCRIFSIDSSITVKECVRRQKEEGPHLIFSLTGFYVRSPEDGEAGGEDSKFMDVPGLHILPYSGHSYHGELMEFISYVKPHSIKPIVFDRKKYSNTIIPECMFNLCFKPISKCSESNETIISDDADYYSCPDEDLVNVSPVKSVSPEIQYSENSIENQISNYQNDNYSDELHSSNSGETTSIENRNDDDEESIIDNFESEINDSMQQVNNKIYNTKKKYLDPDTILKILLIPDSDSIIPEENLIQNINLRSHVTLKPNEDIGFESNKNRVRKNSRSSKSECKNTEPVYKGIESDNQNLEFYAENKSDGSHMTGMTFKSGKNPNNQPSAATLNSRSPLVEKSGSCNKSSNLVQPDLIKFSDVTKNVDNSQGSLKVGSLDDDILKDYFLNDDGEFNFSPNIIEFLESEEQNNIPYKNKSDSENSVILETPNNSPPSIIKTTPKDDNIKFPLDNYFDSSSTIYSPVLLNSSSSSTSSPTYCLGKLKKNCVFNSSKCKKSTNNFFEICNGNNENFLDTNNCDRNYVRKSKRTIAGNENVNFGKANVVEKRSISEPGGKKKFKKVKNDSVSVNSGIDFNGTRNSTKFVGNSVDEDFPNSNSVVPDLFDDLSKSNVDPLDTELLEEEIITVSNDSGLDNSNSLLICEGTENEDSHISDEKSKLNKKCICENEDFKGFETVFPDEANTKRSELLDNQTPESKYARKRKIPKFLYNDSSVFKKGKLVPSPSEEQKHLQILRKTVSHFVEKILKNEKNINFSKTSPNKDILKAKAEIDKGSQNEDCDSFTRIISDQSEKNLIELDKVSRNAGIVTNLDTLSQLSVPASQDVDCDGFTHKMFDLPKNKNANECELSQNTDISTLNQLSVSEKVDRSSQNDKMLDQSNKYDDVSKNTDMVKELERDKNWNKCDDVSEITDIITNVDIVNELSVLVEMSSENETPNRFVKKLLDEQEDENSNKYDDVSQNTDMVKELERDKNWNKCDDVSENTDIITNVDIVNELSVPVEMSSENETPNRFVKKLLDEQEDENSNKYNDVSQNTDMVKELDRDKNWNKCDEVSENTDIITNVDIVNELSVPAEIRSENETTNRFVEKFLDEPENKNSNKYDDVFLSEKVDKGSQNIEMVDQLKKDKNSNTCDEISQNMEAIIDLDNLIQLSAPSKVDRSSQNEDCEGFTHEMLGQLKRDKNSNKFDEISENTDIITNLDIVNELSVSGEMSSKNEKTNRFVEKFLEEPEDKNSNKYDDVSQNTDMVKKLDQNIVPHLNQFFDDKSNENIADSLNGTREQRLQILYSNLMNYWNGLDGNVLVTYEIYRNMKLFK